MSYELESVSQKYGNANYLAHNLKGNTPEEDRRVFAMRIESFGIIDFGYMKSGTVKKASLAELNIKNPISLKAIFAFNTSDASDEIRFYLYRGNIEVVEIKFSSSEMPYKFPPGAIVDPSLSIVVKPKVTTSSVVIYWQPIHIIQYDLIP